MFFLRHAGTEMCRMPGHLGRLLQPTGEHEGLGPTSCIWMIFYNSLGCSMLIPT
jgi:hypothetical protein